MTTGSARWLVVGLGNPGKNYAHTRHNLGARIVTALQGELDQPAFRRVHSVSSRVSKNEHVLALPTTFMNDSGRAVAALRKKFSLPLERTLVVHDDKDLAFGQLKLQKGRSSAGHRGAQSIIGAVGSKNFRRLRIGLGSPPPGTETDAFVLEPFTDAEEDALTTTVIPSALHTLTALLRTPAEATEER